MEHERKEAFINNSIREAFGESAVLRADEFLVLRQRPSTRPQSIRLTFVIGADEEHKLKAFALTGNEVDGFNVHSSEEVSRFAPDEYVKFLGTRFYSSKGKEEAMITAFDGGMPLMVDQIQYASPVDLSEVS